MRRTTKSAEVAALRGDRQVDDYYYGARSATLEIEYVMRNTAFDELFAMHYFGSWSGGILNPGTTFKSATFELMHTDIGVYELLVGAVSKSLTFSVGEDGYVRCKQSFIGRVYSVSSSSVDASPTAADLSAVARLDGGASAVAIGFVTDNRVTAFEATLENSLTETWGVRDRTTLDICAGRLKVTGSITALFENSTRITQFLNETAQGVSLVSPRGSQTFNAIFAGAKFTAVEEPVESEGPVLQKISFQALGAPSTFLLVT
jgi:hypothetical protein